MAASANRWKQPTVGAAALALAGKNASQPRRKRGVPPGGCYLSYWPGYDAQRRNFSTVVLDPPAFAKSAKIWTEPSGGPREIICGLCIAGAGGILITCSCSHHVSKPHLTRNGGRASSRRPPQPCACWNAAASSGLSYPPHGLRKSLLKCLILQVVYGISPNLRRANNSQNLVS